MKIVFMGTPAFAVVSLEKLLGSEHSILAVVTVPDKPQGRGQKLRPSPVKQVARKHSIQVLQPENLKSEDFSRQLKEIGAELFVVVAFRILPRGVFMIPPKGTLNLHASLLPRYRGAAPINWALMNGDANTGVTTMLIDEKVDTGDILLQEKIPIDPDTTAGELHDQLALIGADLLLETINRLEQARITPRHQVNEIATKAPKLTREMMQLDFFQPAVTVHNKIRGLSPFPGAFCYFRGRPIKLLRSASTDIADTTSAPGEVIRLTESGFCIQCSRGVLEILEVLPEGKKQMSARAFIHGSRLTAGERLERLINE